MNKYVDKTTVFDALKPLLEKYKNTLAVVTDEADTYHLNTQHIMKNKKALFFGAVQIKKNYVSFHLMPVYVEPALLNDISPALRKRMQGKSCFNFTSIDSELLEQLEALTQSGYDFYAAQAYILDE